jgi:methionyl-tRNA formyltransferase
MRLIFFGTGSFALPSLRALAEHVVLVVTQPDRPSGRGMKFHASPAKTLAEELGIPCETPEKSRAPEFVEKLESLNADALVVASYGQILSQRVLDSAKRGGINLHGSILPAYRGAAPIQRCILNGDVETGVTLMQMDKGMDTGDIIEISRVPIDPDETYGQLQDRLAVVAAELSAQWLPKICTGDYPRGPQGGGLATMAPKIEKAEAELSFFKEAQAEYNRFRAFTPSPGAYLRTSAGTLKLLEARLAGDYPLASIGEVHAVSPDLVVQFAEGAMALREVQPEGKKKISGRDFANGARLRVGSCLAIT